MSDFSQPIVPQPATYKDRSTWLVVFGVLQIFGGLLFVLLALLSLVVFLAAREGTLPGGMIVAIPLFYLLIAGYLVVLGIGAIRKRRWARTLMLLTSWIGLLFGTSALVFIAALPSPATPPG